MTATNRAATAHNAVWGVTDLVAGYEAGLPIVKGANLMAHPGEILAILGPNGAGKSTLVKAAAGVVPVFSGRITVEGRDITSVPAHRRVHEGLAFVPQTENIFANLTVAENMELAAAVVKGQLAKGTAREHLAPIWAMFPDLDRQRNLPAGRLSGGQRQMLAVARALISKPRVLMLDEPSAGLSPKLVDDVFTQLRRVRDTGVTLILVEQNMKAALTLADRAAVLVEGREQWVAPPAEMRGSARLTDLYLGRVHAPATGAV